MDPTNDVIKLMFTAYSPQKQQRHTDSSQPDNGCVGVVVVNSFDNRNRQFSHIRAPYLVTYEA